MHPKQSIPQGIWRLAAEQGGVFSHAQVVELGLTRHVIQRALDDKIWWQAARGLYSLTPYRTWLGSAHGGLLLAGDGAVLGGAAAGHLYGWCAAPEVIDVYVPARRRDRGVWRFHQIAAEGRGTPARTTPERTALDLCAGLAPADAISLLADALHSRRTTASRLLEQLERMPKLLNREALADVLTDVAAGILSELERRFSVEVLARHGLPLPARQLRVSGTAQTDVAFDAQAVIAELDGRLGHEGSGTFRDHRRDNRNTSKGWVTLRYGWDDVVGDPCAVAKEIAQVLQSRGWRGAPTQCAHCAAAA